MAQLAILREEIPIPEGIDVTIADEVTVKGSKGQLSRKFNHKSVVITKEDGNVVLEVKFPKKKLGYLPTKNARTGKGIF